MGWKSKEVKSEYDRKRYEQRKGVKPTLERSDISDLFLEMDEFRRFDTIHTYQQVDGKTIQTIENSEGTFTMEYGDHNYVEKVSFKKVRNSKLVFC